MANKLFCIKSKNTLPIRKFRHDSLFLKITTEKSKKIRNFLKVKWIKKKSLAVKTSEKHNLQIYALCSSVFNNFRAMSNSLNLQSCLVFTSTQLNPRELGYLRPISQSEKRSKINMKKITEDSALRLVRYISRKFQHASKAFSTKPSEIFKIRLNYQANYW